MLTHRTKLREQDPQERAHNFDEVCLGFNLNEAMEESSRCLHCKNPRCVSACPVGIDIPGFIAQIKEGHITEAAEIIGHDSSLPAVCGRVCPQESQCEGSCVLGIKGESVAIGGLERFTADYCAENDCAPTINIEHIPNAPKVAVIGSGPAGLACAFDLAKYGLKVKVFEALHRLGGVLEYGIPEFRLPKEKVLKREIETLKKLGVEFETNVIVGRTVTIDDLFEKEGYKAVFVGTGAGLPKFMGIPGENLNGVFSANEFLTRNNLMKAYRTDYMTPIHIGKEVCVVGGGNVAMDAARTALRLGANVHIIYRRTEKELPARREEVQHAKAEGVLFELLTNPVEVLGNDNGEVRALRCVRMELGEADESGRRSPIPIPGSEFEIPVQTVIMALGTSPNPLIVNTTVGLEATRRACIKASDDGVTTREGVFAGGDAVTGAATVILAMGAGRKAAAAIKEYLKV